MVQHFAAALGVGADEGVIALLLPPSVNQSGGRFGVDVDTGALLHLGVHAADVGAVGGDGSEFFHADHLCARFGGRVGGDGACDARAQHHHIDRFLCADFGDGLRRTLPAVRMIFHEKASF